MRRFPTGSALRWGATGLLLAAAGCVEPYMPEVAADPSSKLVVDGFINGNGPTRIHLSRSVSLASATVPTEAGAKVTLADNTGASYPLTEKKAGYYVSDSLVLPAGRQYQLRFTTRAGVAYASDRVPLKVSPPIDKLGFRRDNEQVLLLLDTHDATGQSRYYRWGFTETWLFHSAYESDLEYQMLGGSTFILGRTTPIYTCWRTEQNTSIRQGTSAQDALREFPALILSARAERFTIRYSALVSQYVETPEEYAYYELLRKNTEALGTLNDPLPVQLTGNVHRLDNASEPVLGYVGAHTVQQRRLFIDKQDLNLPANWAFTSAYPDCIEKVFPAAYKPGFTPIKY